MQSQCDWCYHEKWCSISYHIAALNKCVSCLWTSNFISTTFRKTAAPSPTVYQSHPALQLMATILPSVTSPALSTRIHHLFRLAKPLTSLDVCGVVVSTQMMKAFSDFLANHHLKQWLKRLFHITQHHDLGCFYTLFNSYLSDSQWCVPVVLPSVGASFQCDRISGRKHIRPRSYLWKQTLGNKETEEWDSWQPEPTTCLVWKYPIFWGRHPTSLWTAKRTLKSHLQELPS